MFGRRACPAFAAAIAFAFLVPASAGAATLYADYQFQDTLASSAPGAPDLQNVGPGNTFVTETVGCTPSRVLQFPKGTGVEMDPPTGDFTYDYTVLMLFRLADVDGYRRIYGGEPMSDNGLYVHDGRLAFYDAGPILGANTVFAGNTYA